MDSISEPQIQQIIGQLESSISKIEPYLDDESFKDYCDSTYSAIAEWRAVLKKVRTVIEKPNTPDWEDMVEKK
jgi:hypothetical protein